MNIKLPAIKGIIGDWVYYQTVIPFSIVNKLIDNDHSIREYQSLDDHLQRELSKRAKSIGEYLVRENSRFFNSAIVGIYGDNPKWYNFEFDPSIIPEMEFDDTFLGSLGILIFNGSEKLFSIDGQHRIEGIKQALNKEVDERFKYDELPVIFVGHDDSKEGKVRTRRLFSEINTKAVPVGKLDDLITNEDKPTLINTRKLFANYSPFQKEKFIALKGSSNIDSDAEELITILSLKDINIELYKPFYKHRDYRPDDETINSLYDLSLSFWDDLLVNIKALSEVLINGESISAYRNVDGGHFLFRPIGLKHCAEMYANWLTKFNNQNTNEFWHRINKIDPNLNGVYWKGVLWDNAKHTMKKISVRFFRNYFSYLLGYEYNFDYTYKEYNKQIGIEEEQNYIPLPPCPN